MIWAADWFIVISASGNFWTRFLNLKTIFVLRGVQVRLVHNRNLLAKRIGHLLIWMLNQK